MSTPSRSETFAALVERQPDNELFRFSLAQSLVTENRLVDAARHFQFCIQKKPDWMMARIHLGKPPPKLGQKADARLQFQEALKLAIDQHHEGPQDELRALMAEHT